MKLDSLSKTSMIVILIISYVLLSHGYWIVFVSLLAILLLFLYFNHIKLMHFRESHNESIDVFLSPCDGIVKGIIEENGFKKIRIQMTLLNRWALFLPQTSELELLGNSTGKRHWRGKKKWPSDELWHTNLALKNLNDHLFFLKVFPGLVGVRPLVLMKTGDRGQIGAHFGRLLMGGTIVIELPDTVNLIININDRVKAGKTMLAGSQNDGK